ncbi:hypothetical protein [Shinella sp.]|nr:hypothetical protein [Shinella sp.]MDX3973746.1 hypothetical protein [Shinella sp.]
MSISTISASSCKRRETALALRSAMKSYPRAISTKVAYFINWLIEEAATP